MLSSLFQSPKSLLAQKLAEILSVYFQVDPRTIQSNLVSDTKITLHQVGLKPIETFGCLIVGSIEHVEFSWKWGGDSLTSFIRETFLTLQGVDVTILIKDTSAVEFDRADEATVEGQAVDLGSYVQQIIDHLTLKISNVKITVETTLHQGKIVTETQSIDLVSMGRRDDASELSQRLSVSSLLAYMIDEKGDRHPVMDAIPYAISIDRLFGRRFQGLSYGLRAVGESFGEMVLYARDAQVSLLSFFLNLWQQKTASLERPAKLPSDIDESFNSMKYPPPATTFELPIPSISVHLSNGTVLRFPESRLEYACDGSLMRCSGSGSLEIDGAAFVTLTKGTVWSFDAISMTLTVENTLQNDLLAEGFLLDSTLKHLVQGISKASESVSTITREVSTTNTVSPSFNLAIQGNVVASFLQSTEHEESSSSLAITMGPCSMAPEASSIASLHLLGQFQDSQVDVELPSLSYNSHAESISVCGGMTVRAGSFETLERLRVFVTGFMDSWGLNSAPEAIPDASSVGVSLLIPFIEASVLGPQALSMEVEDVNVSAASASVRCLSWSGKDLCEGQAADLFFERKRSDIVGAIGAISSLHIQGLGKLEQSPATLRVRYSQNNIDLNLAHVNVCLDENILRRRNGSDLLYTLPTLLGLSFSLNLDDVLLSFPSPSHQKVALKGARFQVSQEMGNELKVATKILCSGTKGLCWTASHGQKLALECMPFQILLDSNGNVQTGQFEGARLTLSDENGSNVMSIEFPFINGDYLTRTLTVGQTLQMTIQSMDSVHCCMKEGWLTNGEHQQGANDSFFRSLGDFSCTLEHVKCAANGPIPLSFDFKNCTLKNQGGRSSLQLSVSALSASMSKTGSFCTTRPFDIVANYETARPKIQASRVDLRLEVSEILETTVAFGGATAQLDEAFVVESVLCDGFDFDSRKFGGLEVSLPRMVFDKLLSKVELTSSIRCSIGSLDSVMTEVEDCLASLKKLQSAFGLGCTQNSPDSRATLYTLKCPEVLIAVDEVLMMLVEMKDVIIQGATSARLGSLTVSTVEQHRMAVHGISVTVLQGEGCMQIDSITELIIPGAVRLQTPLVNTVAEYNGTSGISIKGSLCEVTSLMISSRPVESSTATTPIPQLPVSLACCFERFIVVSEGVTTTFEKVLLSAQQGTSLIQGDTPSICCQFQAAKFCNAFAELTNSKFRCNIVDYHVIENLEVTVLSALVRSGFSSIQWSKMFAPKRASPAPVAICLPNARVDPIVAEVEYKGAVVSTAASLRLPEYNGNKESSLESLVSFYTKSVCAQMPSFFSNSKILGGSVVDMGAISTGRVLVGSALGGALGSVGGIVALDGIKGAICSGKKDRGASDSDGYKFGDFTRGIVRGVKETTRSGTVARSDNQYQFGDFSRGASASMAQYGDQNRERLGAAGGSTIGMMVGAAALGPLGLVAGAVAGSVAGAKALKKAATRTTGPPNLLENNGVTDVQQQVPESACDPEATASAERSQDAVEDLLSLGNPMVLSSPSAPNNVSETIVTFVRSAPAPPSNPHYAGDLLDLGNTMTQSYQPPVRNSSGGDFTIRSDASRSHYQDLRACTFPSTEQQESFATERSTASQQQPNAFTRQRQDFDLCSSQCGNSDSYGQSDQQSQDDRQAPAYVQSQPQPYAQGATQLHQQAIRSERLGRVPGAMQTPSQSSQQRSGYQFGDLTKSVIARGKQARGADGSDSNYKFGDFTRGLFGK